LTEQAGSLLAATFSQALLLNKTSVFVSPLIVIATYSTELRRLAESK